MKTLIGTVLTCTLLAGGCAHHERAEHNRSHSSQNLSQAQRDLASMSWLAGTWSGAMWGGEFVAYYSTPDGGKLLSYSKLLQDGNLAFYEFELFDVHDGAVRLTPHPGGKPAGGFRLASINAADHKAVFENLEKDFPTRVTYHQQAANTLVITLDDPTGASDEVEEFTLTRVP